MIRIPGAKLIPINYNPHSGSSACALVINDVPTLQAMSKYTGGSAETSTFNAEFVQLSKMIETAFEGSEYRNTDHTTKPPPPKAGETAKVGVPIRLEPYQKIGIAYALSRKGRAGLFDPMGLGKTVQAIGLALTCPEKYLPLVVVCPRNALGAWANQLGASGDVHKSWVKLGKLRVRLIQTNEELESAANFITTEPNSDYAYVIWNELLTVPKGVSGEAKIQAGQVRDKCLHTIASAIATRGLLVFDEAHYFRVPTSEMFGRGYMMASTAAHVLALTGTPSLSSVTQTLPILALVDPHSAVVPEVRRFGGIVQSTDEWPAVQTSFIERYAGRGTDNRPTVASLPESHELKNFAPAYTDALAQRVEADFRQMAVRRSRADVVTKTLAPHLAIGITKKRRELILEPYTGVEGSEQYSRTSDSPHRYYQRAGLIALLDGQILENVLKGKLTAAQTPARQMAVLMSSRVIRGIMEQFQCATARLKSGVGTESAEAMAQTVVPAAVRRFGEDLKRNADDSISYRPTVYFVDNIATLNDLAGRLWDTYHTIPELELYIYSGDRAGRVTGSKASVKNVELRDVNIASFARDTALQKIADRFEPDDYEKPRILVAAQAGREGVDLPGGAEVIFVQRFESPGLEEQAEDRINRANRNVNAPLPSIRYYMPEHYNSFVLLNRLERRRAEALRTYGETPASDYSTPLVFPYGKRTKSQRMDYLRMSFAAEREITNDFQDYILSRIEWALQTVRQDKNWSQNAATRLTDTEHVYHTLMQLPDYHKFIPDWCAVPKRRLTETERKAAEEAQRRSQVGVAQAPLGKTKTTPGLPVAQRRPAGQAAATKPVAPRAPAPAVLPVVVFMSRSGVWKPHDLSQQGSAALVPGRYIRFDAVGRSSEVFGRLIPPPRGALAGQPYYQETSFTGDSSGLKTSMLPPAARLSNLKIFTPQAFKNPRWPF